MTSTALEREIERYVAKTPKSRALQAEAERVLPGGSSRGTAHFAPYPFFAERGDGHYVYDVDGNRYLDFMLNATTLIVGHANPMVIEALGEQTRKGTAFSTPTEVQVRVARLLCDRIPSLDTIRFTNSGTEGTLMAIRAAWAFTGKGKLAKFEGAYHGAHEHVAVSVKPPASRLDPAGPTAIPEYPGQPAGVLRDVIVLPYNDLAACDRILRAHKDEVGCLIMEPVMSSFGYVPGDPEFLRGIRKLTEELSIVLIYDEVQSLRIAPGGAQELLGVTPDLSVLREDHRRRAPDRRLRRAAGHHGPVRPHRGRRRAHRARGHVQRQSDDPRRGGGGDAGADPAGLPAPRRARRGAPGEAPPRPRGDRRPDPGDRASPRSSGSTSTRARSRATATSSEDDAEMTRGLYTGLLNEGILLQTTCAGALGVMTTDTEVDTLVDAVGRVVRRLRE